MAFSPAEPSRCHHLEEVPVHCPFISFSCSDTGALAGVDGMGDVSRLSPEVAWSWFHRHGLSLLPLVTSSQYSGTGVAAAFISRAALPSQQNP